jgi:hypothetical protein
MRTDLPTPLTVENLREQLLLWGNPVDITAVMVVGRWLRRDGRVLGADEAAIWAQCREAARKLWGMRHK